VVAALVVAALVVVALVAVALVVVLVILAALAEVPAVALVAPPVLQKDLTPGGDGETWW